MKMFFAAVHLHGTIFTQADGIQHGWPLKEEVVYIVNVTFQSFQIMLITSIK